MTDDPLIQKSFRIEKSSAEWLEKKGKGLMSNSSHALRVQLWEAREREQPTGRAVPKPDKGDT